jgi:hypothetical protein
MRKKKDLFFDIHYDTTGASGNSYIIPPQERGEMRV